VSGLPDKIVAAAINARTLADALALQELIASDVGTRHERPLGDRWGNQGMLTRAGSVDHKLLENVTNGQDAVLELLARLKFGDAPIPYATPHEAAADLLHGVLAKDAAEKVCVQLHEAGAPARKTAHLTPVIRDFGCGMDPDYIARSLFFLGSQHKSKAPWQQGAFGIGGASTFAHADAVVLATRSDPRLLRANQEDRIAVAVCLWQQLDKGRCIYYLTSTPWDDGQRPEAEPWSTSAANFPEFAPGTHLALIGYGSDHIHSAAWGGEFSFERMLNTRLFDPVIPIRIDNRISPKAHPQNYRGLKRQFAENPRRSGSWDCPKDCVFGLI
jgi:hypothetical protein